MNVCDDNLLIVRFFADNIRVYRAGDMGCIIQTIGLIKFDWKTPCDYVLF